MAERAYIALGSNMGNRRENLCRSVRALFHLHGCKGIALSPVYETEPVDTPFGGRFYNAAAAIDTDISPRALLGACLGIEAAMGRRRTCENGPRVIDLDLLLYGDVISSDPELILPHPRMMERAFVLRPLLDICDDERFRKALEKMSLEGIHRVGNLDI